MTSRDFCYWLQRYFEIQQSNTREGVANISPHLDEGQIETIRKHLSMVFVHEIDPSFGADNQKLNAVHGNITQAEFHKMNPHLDPNKTYEAGEPRPRC